MTAIATYDLGGHLLEVTASTRALADRFDKSFGGLRCRSDAKVAYRIELAERNLPAPPSPSRLIYEGAFPGDGHGQFFASDRGTFLLFKNRASLSVQYADRRATITVAPGHDGREGSTVDVAAIEAAADCTGQIMLHAAALTLPGQTLTVLIYAPSGTGKTTTTLALLRAGYGLCSDDASFIAERSTGFFGWGFPCGVKVHRQTAALLPWLAPMLGPDWNGEGEQSLSRERLAEIAGVEDFTPRPIAALLRLVRADGVESTIVPVARTEVLASLAADNVRTGPTGLLPLQQRRFALLSRLAAALPVYEIRAGSNLADLGSAIQAKLTPG